MCNEIVKAVNTSNALECCESAWPWTRKYDEKYWLHLITYTYQIHFLWSWHNVEMLTVCRQQHTLPPQKRIFLRKCWCFETENVSTQEDLEPPTFGFMPNFLPIFWNTGSNGINVIVCKINIFIVNCAKTAAFSFESISDVLVCIHVIGY